MIADNAVLCVASPVENDLNHLYPYANLRVVIFSGDFASEYVGAGCAGIVWSMASVMREPNTAQFMCEMDLVAVQEVLR
jgi:hypothetical protein